MNQSSWECPSPQRIMDLANAFYESCVLFSASDLGVFGRLAGGKELMSDSIAGTCGLDRRAARLLLDACVAVGLLVRTPGGTIYVLDMMTDATRARPKFSALFAVNMALTARHGWVFSSDELAGWLAEAGFNEFACRPLPPPMPHWLASARKPTGVSGPKP